MSGFDAGWLALREPVDHASRASALANRVRAHFEDRAELTVVDLGCGAGSNLRALAPLLPAHQHWHLIDGDPALLDAARARLGEWADEARTTGAGLTLLKGSPAIEVSFECAALTRRDLSFADLAPDLVTAAALFDLVSRDWLECLVAALAPARIPLYSVLTYDGRAEWSPPCPHDGDIVAAFNHHQRGDKGFGPALGPDAARALEDILARQGYTVSAADSPWELTTREADLVAALVEGFGAAAAEIKPARREVIAQWTADRARARSAIIGHRDVFAVPG